MACSLDNEQDVTSNKELESKQGSTERWKYFILPYYASITFSPPWSTWLLQQGDWLTLFGCSVLLLLSLIKDRGVISIHGLYRLVAIALVAIISYAW
ncbi:hypothetical protein H4J42_17485, partial [Colwellia sp. BRX8-8]|nr:hypothetical protein [Colwellia sp. BRX8-8]